jgi:NADPH:quinone reductase-like Zn-dependent oxidoreductase
LRILSAGEPFAANIDRQRMEEVSRLADAGKLNSQVETVLPLDQVRQALAQIQGRHTRGKIVLQIG